MASRLSASETTVTSYDRAKLRGRIAAIHSFMASYRGDVPAIIQHARQALALSLNVPTVKLQEQIGVNNVISWR